MVRASGDNLIKFRRQRRAPTTPDADQEEIDRAKANVSYKVMVYTLDRSYRIHLTLFFSFSFFWKGEGYRLIINRLSLQKGKIKSIGFNNVYYKSTSLFRFHHRDSVIEIPSLRFHRPDSIVQIPSLKIHHKDSIIEIPSLRFRH